MPNGHHEPPHLDTRDPNAAYMVWLGSVVTDIYHGLGELKDEVTSFGVWKRAKEEEALRKQAARAEIARLQEARQRWWNGTKTRAETVGVLVGVAVTAFGLGGAIARILL